jgi:NifB/MoaA-like Fe-S oxidoreductase
MCTAERNNFESELRLDLLDEMIKRTPKEQNLTQEELGALKTQVKIKIEFKNSDDLIIA